MSSVIHSQGLTIDGVPVVTSANLDAQSVKLAALAQSVVGERGSVRSAHMSACGSWSVAFSTEYAALCFFVHYTKGGNPPVGDTGMLKFRIFQAAGDWAVSART